MKSPVFKRSIIISGHKTSVSAEAEFWDALKDIAASQDRRLSDLVTDIDKTRQAGNLSSAIRLFVLDHFQKHARAAAAVSLVEQRTSSIMPVARATPRAS
jgi:predicted DNA-binding ribbon-helix-helix protein